ncbi:MAG: tyrosine-type recombinase/integrase, partial [Terriglobales bacterium]
MITLRHALRDYLGMRRALGYKLYRDGIALEHFISFLEERKQDYITVAYALEWAQQPSSAQPATWAGRLKYVRGFAQYLSAADSRTEIPSSTLLPHKAKRARPYIYSEAEICSLLAAALELPTDHAIKKQTYYCLLGLLAVTGMRISEALDLKIANVDFFSGMLTIEDSKLGKSRLIPLHASTEAVLAKYVRCREEFLDGQQSTYFFVNMVGNRLDEGTVRRTFYFLSRMIGIRQADASRGPRLHDFRHGFAVNTLLQWYRDGVDVESRLPALATFLGHVHVSDTYWYLT